MNQSIVNFFTLADDPKVQMSLFSPWHIAYMLIIILFPVICFIFTRKSKEKTKNRILIAFSLAIATLYFGDFFLQPFYNGGEMIIDKLPFHVCTFLCPAILFVQFARNRVATWLYSAIALLAIVTPTMYFCYPITAFGDNFTPWCYQVLQTFLYHGMVYAWGMYALLSGNVKLKYRMLLRVLSVLTGLPHGQR